MHFWGRFVHLKLNLCTFVTFRMCAVVQYSDSAVGWRAQPSMAERPLRSTLGSAVLCSLLSAECTVPSTMQSTGVLSSTLLYTTLHSALYTACSLHCALCSLLYSVQVYSTSLYSAVCSCSLFNITTLYYLLVYSTLLYSEGILYSTLI